MIAKAKVVYSMLSYVVDHWFHNQKDTGFESQLGIYTLCTVNVNQLVRSDDHQKLKIVRKYRKELCEGTTLNKAKNRIDPKKCSKNFSKTKF